MKKAKILFVSQEIAPFLEFSPMAQISRFLPQGIQEKGREIRTFMPRFGCINERRNQLHEVIRLSGMNLIIDDTDHPLIIKVASIQSARMQVYFIDNQEYFERKTILRDETGKLHEDNDDRMIFFCRGVMETVKKLGWVPDIVHCHGWISSLIPFYIKTGYKESPAFQNTKIVFSAYEDDFKGTEKINDDFIRKVTMEGIYPEDMKVLKNATYLTPVLSALHFSDAIITGSENLHPAVESYIDEIRMEKPVIQFRERPMQEYIDSYSDLYDDLLVESEVFVD